MLHNFVYLNRNGPVPGVPIFTVASTKDDVRHLITDSLGIHM